MFSFQEKRRERKKQVIEKNIFLSIFNVIKYTQLVITSSQVRAVPKVAFTCFPIITLLRTKTKGEKKNPGSFSAHISGLIIKPNKLLFNSSTGDLHTYSKSLNQDESTNHVICLK